MNMHEIVSDKGLKKTKIDFTNPKLDEDDFSYETKLNFHIEVIYCIIQCTINNRFGIF